MYYAVSQFGLSKRQTTKLVNLPRSTNQYKTVKKNDDELRNRIKELAYKHKRYGSPRLYVFLKKEGLVINHKKRSESTRRKVCHCVVVLRRTRYSRFVFTRLG